MKSDETCNMRRSTESSLPVRSSVVTAAVKIDLLSSATRLSSSTLHSATVAGFLAAIEFKALTAPNRKIVLGRRKKKLQHHHGRVQNSGINIRQHRDISEAQGVSKESDYY